MTHVFSKFWLVVATVIALFATPAASSAGEVRASHSPVAGASVIGTSVFHGYSHNVCCTVGGRPWTTTARRCWRSGGWEVPYHRCFHRPAQRVCCKRGRHEWWAWSHRDCHRDHGIVVHGSYCRWH